MNLRLTFCLVIFLKEKLKKEKNAVEMNVPHVLCTSKAFLHNTFMQSMN